MNSIGENIKQIRVKFGVNQSELAQKIGVTKAAISRYESGQREPRIEHIKAIADVFGISTDELLGISPLPQQESKMHFNGHEKVTIFTSEDQEFVAFDEYLDGMGYRTFLDLGTFDNINPNHYWTMQDLRNQKQYFVSEAELTKLMHSINSYAKYQINALIQTLSEIPQETKDTAIIQE